MDASFSLKYPSFLQDSLKILQTVQFAYLIAKYKIFLIFCENLKYNINNKRVPQLSNKNTFKNRKN